jgi:CDP-diglyceride synthetase
MSIDAIPSWSLFLAVVVIVLASIEGGYLLGRFAHKRAEDEKESPVAAIAGSILGLGAFLLAFTFGIVANRYDARKELVREEANTIRTAWLRSDFLPEPDRAETRGLIRKYLDARLEFTDVRDTTPERVQSFLAQVEEDQARLWEIAVANARKDLNSDVAALYIESLNELFAIHALRVAQGLQARIPFEIWFMLIALTALGMSAVGYQTGIAGSKRSMVRPILAVSFALVMFLIAELDLPGGGFVKVPQQPLIDVQTWMSRSPGA